MSRMHLFRSRTAQHRRRVVAVLALLLAAGYFAIGQQPASRSAETATPAAAPPASDAGMKAYIDPVTGQLRPAEQEEMQTSQPASAALRSAPPPAAQVFRHPSGAIGVHLGPEQMVYSVATIGTDGKLRYECVKGETAAGEKVHAPRQGGLDVR